LVRALVIGGSGYVGRAILARLGAARGIGTWHRHAVEGLRQFDAAAGLRTLLRDLPNDMSHVFVPYGLINPEACARDPVATAKVNVDGVVRLLEDAFAAGLKPIFVSTDYVYDGTRGMRTEDEPQSPNTEYGRQKAAVERWLQARPEPWLIARLSKVVSGDTATHSVLGQWVNDIRAGTPMRSATDQVFSPAHVDDIAGALVALAEADLTGIYHVAGPAPLSRYDLNVMLVDAVRAADPGLSPAVEPCSLRDIPFLERRPLDTSLSVAKLRGATGSPFRSMAQACREVAAMHFGGTSRSRAGAAAR